MIEVNSYDYDIIKLTLLNPKKVKELLIEKLEEDLNYNTTSYGDEDEESKKKGEEYKIIENKLQELEYIVV